MAPLKKVLIVSCRFDEDRNGGARPWRVPQAMAPAFLGGVFHPERCEIRLYSELASGPLHDLKLLAWPDMLVLTGLQVDFDRFLHLTAYARTLNPRVIVVAGGSIVEVAPNYCRQFFDYCCTGPVEDLGDVVRDVWGDGYVASSYAVRHDLAYWVRKVGYVESSRSCNFSCSFCTLSIGRRPYTTLPPDELEAEILRTRRKWLFFLDNNFYGNDHERFQQKMETLQALKTSRRLSAWGAEVTADFFYEEERLRQAAATGCTALFCGVESFDPDCLRAYNKRQNIVEDPIALIRRCLDAGILFLYGLIFDPLRRELSSLERELDFILSSPDIPLPSYFTLPIPFPGTPFFFEMLDQNAILPGTRIRDLDAYTLTLQPREGLEAFSRIFADLVRLRGRRWAVVKHELAFWNRYRRTLSLAQQAVSALQASMFLRRKYRNPRRTFVSTTEILDPQYQPMMPLDAKYEAYFQPTRLIEPDGSFNLDLEEVLQRRVRQLSPV